MMEQNVADDKPEGIGIPLDDGKPSRGPLYFLIGIIVMVLFILGMSYQPSSTEPMVYNVSVNKTVMISVPTQSSLSSYTTISDRTYDANLSLIGYLREEVVFQQEGAKLIYKYLVDDEGNKLRLDLYSTKWDGLFTNVTNISEANLSLHNVSGRLYFWQNVLLFEAISIDPAERITEEVASTILENETKSDDRPRPARINLTFGFEKISNILTG